MLHLRLLSIPESCFFFSFFFKLSIYVLNLWPLCWFSGFWYIFPLLIEPHWKLNEDEEKNQHKFPLSSSVSRSWFLIENLNRMVFFMYEKKSINGHWCANATRKKVGKNFTRMSRMNIENIREMRWRNGTNCTDTFRWKWKYLSVDKFSVP